MPALNGSAAMAMLPEMALLFVWLGVDEAAKQQGSVHVAKVVGND
jgi:hypothetical protein